jgi:hypothetical protein
MVECDLTADVADVIACDPDVKQARLIAEAARARLAKSVSCDADDIDLAEAQEMLRAVADARVIVGDAEDRVLRHHGLLTAAEASRRAAKRRPASARPAAQPAPQLVPQRSARSAPRRAEPGAQTSAGPAVVVPAPRTWLIVAALTFALTCVVGAGLARRLSVRLLRPYS